MSVRSWFTTWLQPKPLGQRGEDLAARYLRQKGYHILARHHRSRWGELDIVAVEGKPGDRTVVLVEVKTRRSTDKGHPAEVVNPQKQQRLTQAGLAYLKSYHLLDYPARFDVVAITWPVGVRHPTIEHYQDAFPAVGHGQFYN